MNSFLKVPSFNINVKCLKTTDLHSLVICLQYSRAEINNNCSMCLYNASVILNMLIKYFWSDDQLDIHFVLSEVILDKL